MLFLTFEGLDGSGKSTQVERLRIRLESAGYRAVALREPGGSELSERIRELLLDPQLHVLPFPELLLFSAARAQLVSRTIRPELQRGSVVLCDRFVDSTTAYQGGGRGLEEMDWLVDFNRRVTGGLMPRRTYYFRLSAADAAARRALRRDEAAGGDRMEGAGEAFFTRVAEAYDRIAEREPGRIMPIDATQSVDQIEETVWHDVSCLLHEETGTGAIGAG